MTDGQDPAAQAAAASSQADGQDTQNDSANVQDVAALPEWAQKVIRETRKEAADHRTKLQKFEDRDKSELQKAQDAVAAAAKERDEALTALRAERAERVVIAAASKANAIRPDAVVRLVRDDIAYGDDGQPTNVDAVIVKAKKDYPELFRAAAGGADSGAGGTTPPALDMNARIRQAAGRTSA